MIDTVVLRRRGRVFMSFQILFYLIITPLLLFLTIFFKLAPIILSLIFLLFAFVHNFLYFMKLGDLELRRGKYYIGPLIVLIGSLFLLIIAKNLDGYLLTRYRGLLELTIRFTGVGFILMPAIIQRFILNTFSPYDKFQFRGFPISILLIFLAASLVGLSVSIVF